ncbi:hypothetical protein [Kineococcus auxinigenes]
MRQADVDPGAKPGTSTDEGTKLREADRWIEFLNPEQEVLPGG